MVEGGGDLGWEVEASKLGRMSDVRAPAAGRLGLLITAESQTIINVLRSWTASDTIKAKQLHI